MHQILCANTATHGTHAHATTADVRDCHLGLQISMVTFRDQFIDDEHTTPDMYAVIRPGQRPCSWLVPIRTEDGESATECGAPAWDDERGWRCALGHEHIREEVARREGWAYSDPTDAFDATAAILAGLTPVSMDGGSYSGPAPRLY